MILSEKNFSKKLDKDKKKRYNHNDNKNKGSEKK